MSHVEHCDQHGQYHGDYCGECVEATQAENARWKKRAEDMGDKAHDTWDELEKAKARIEELTHLWAKDNNALVDALLQNKRLLETIEEIKSTTCMDCARRDQECPHKPVEMGHIFSDAVAVNDLLFEDRHISADDMKFMKDMNKLPQTNPVGTNHCFSDGCKDPNTCKWTFVKSWGSPNHSGARNIFSISWGWLPGPRDVKRASHFGISIRWNFMEYGFGIYRQIPWEKTDEKASCNY